MVRFGRHQLPAYMWALLIFLSSAMPTRFFEQFGVDYPWLRTCSMFFSISSLAFF